MTTAVIGLGNIGSPLAEELVAGGESVVVATREFSKAAALADRLGKLARAATVEDAISGADGVIFAVTFDLFQKMVVQYSDLLHGKTVIDPSNPVALRDGQLVRLLPEGKSAGSVIAGLIPPDARFVKAFGTLSAESLAKESHRQTDRAVLYYATDDASSGEVAERLIRAAGFIPVKVGGLDVCLRIEVGGELHQFGGLQGNVPNEAITRTALKAGEK
jgi:8-hydroxy-5-deazaflavin:NADPH oxidoreductase